MLADREDLFQPFTCDATPVLMCSTSTRVLEDPPHVLQAHLILLYFYFYFLLQGLTLYFQSLGRCSNGEELPGIDIEHFSFIQLSLGGGEIEQCELAFSRLCSVCRSPHRGGVSRAPLVGAMGR